MIAGVDPTQPTCHRTEWSAVLGRAAPDIGRRRLRQLMMEDEGEERIRAAYRGNYDRLSRIKKRYDPTNLFHINQNIPPAS